MAQEQMRDANSEYVQQQCRHIALEMRDVVARDFSDADLEAASKAAQIMTWIGQACIELAADEVEL